MEQIRKKMMESDPGFRPRPVGGSGKPTARVASASDAATKAQQLPHKLQERSVINISSDEDQDASEEELEESETDDDESLQAPKGNGPRIRRGAVLSSEDEDEDEDEDDKDEDEERAPVQNVTAVRFAPPTKPAVHSGVLVNGLPVPTENENIGRLQQSAVYPPFPQPRPASNAFAPQHNAKQYDMEARPNPLQPSNTNGVNRAFAPAAAIPAPRPLHRAVPQAKATPAPPPPYNTIGYPPNVQAGTVQPIQPAYPPGPSDRGEIRAGFTIPQPAMQNHREEEQGEVFRLPVADGYDPFRTSEQVEEDLKQLIEHAIEDATEEFDPSERFVEGFADGMELLPHQVIGRRWMRDRESGKKFGGILADDMGLGKTIQAITRIVEGMPSKEDRKGGWAKSTLVVCPVTLMDQWEKEIIRIAPHLTVQQHHGSTRSADPKVLARSHVVITSYTIVANEYEAKYGAETSKKKKAPAKSKASDDFIDEDEDEFGYLKKKKAPAKKKAAKCALFGVEWWRVILDEAHNIKNRKAKMSIAACELSGKYRWAMTGTPLQNNIEELYPMFNFLRIKPLNDWFEFKTKIADPVKKNRTKAAMQRLHVVLKAVMLRRSKTALVNGKPILQLPARNVVVDECEFDGPEREFYEALASKAELTFNKFIKEGTAMRQYTAVLTLLLRLRQACNHPSLVAKDFVKDIDALGNAQADSDSDAEENLLAAALNNLNVDGHKKCTVCQIEIDSEQRGGSGRCKACDDVVAMGARRKSISKSGRPDMPPSSAKVRRIVELLLEIEEKNEEGELPHKTIIFSQFTSFLDILEPFLEDEGIKFVRLDGSMIPADRAKVVEKIKKSRSTNVILVSFKAGSTGLNLTCCDHVILSDLWWNPALEDQAFDRAHRFGQKRDVHIYKLTIPLTVEERILQLQAQKRDLATAALSGGKFNKNANKLNLNDLMQLFRHGVPLDEEED